MSMEEAMKASAAKWKYKKYHCLGGLYMYKALRAFGFEDDSTKVTFARKIAGKSADWSQGAALYETQYMPVVLQTHPEGCFEGGSAKSTSGTKSTIAEWAESGEGNLHQPEEVHLPLPPPREWQQAQSASLQSASCCAWRLPKPMPRPKPPAAAWACSPVATASNCWSPPNKPCDDQSAELARDEDVL